MTSRYAMLTAPRGFSVPVVMLGSLLFLPVLGTTAVETIWLLIAPAQMLLDRLVRGRDRQEASTDRREPASR